MTEKTAEQKLEEVESKLALAKKFKFLAQSLAQVPESIRGVIDLAYNAAELAMKGSILLKRDSVPSRHSGVRQIFSQFFIKEGPLPREFGPRLRKALRLRNLARYESKIQLFEKDQEFLEQTAQELIEFLEKEFNEKVKKAGFALIELLVGLVIGLIIIGAIVVWRNQAPTAPKLLPAPTESPPTAPTNGIAPSPSLTNEKQLSPTPKIIKYQAAQDWVTFESATGYSIQHPLNFYARTGAGEQFKDSNNTCGVVFGAFGGGIISSNVVPYDGGSRRQLFGIQEGFDYRFAEVVVHGKKSLMIEVGPVGDSGSGTGVVIPAGDTALILFWSRRGKDDPEVHKLLQSVNLDGRLDISKCGQNKYYSYATFEDNHLSFKYPEGWNIDNVQTGKLELGDNTRFEGVSRVQIVGKSLGDHKGFIFEISYNNKSEKPPEDRYHKIDLARAPSGAERRVLKWYQLPQNLTLVGTSYQACGGMGCVDLHEMLIGEKRGDELYGYFEGKQYFTKLNFIGGTGVINGETATDPAPMAQIVVACYPQKAPIETFNRCYEVMNTFFNTVDRR